MSRVTDSDIPDDISQEVRLDIQATLKAVISNHSDSGLPSGDIVVPFMFGVEDDASPPAGHFRNPADDGWLKWIEYGSSTVTLYSGGAAVPSTAVANTWTDSQTIKKSAAVGVVKAGSDLDTGVPGRFDIAGENVANEDTVLARWLATWTDNTDGSEDASLALSLMTGGSLTDVMTAVGTAVTFPGAVNAVGGLSQNGTTVDASIATNIGTLAEDSTWSTSTKATSGVVAGKVITFTGSSATVVQISRRTKGEFIVVDNSGTAGITFESVASPNAVTIPDGLTLAAGKTAVIRWKGTNADGQAIRITGENV